MIFFQSDCSISPVKPEFPAVTEGGEFFFTSKTSVIEAGENICTSQRSDQEIAFDLGSFFQSKNWLGTVNPCQRFKFFKKILKIETQSHALTNRVAIISRSFCTLYCVKGHQKTGRTAAERSVKTHFTNTGSSRARLI